MLASFDFLSPPGENLINITSQVREYVKKSKVKEGICLVFVPHTTAAITLNSAIDPSTSFDILNELGHLVPKRVDFKHQYDTPADAAGHIKSTLIGASLALIVSNGDLLIGNSQSLLFCEFDGPRSRNVFLRIMPDMDQDINHAEKNNH